MKMIHRLFPLALLSALVAAQLAHAADPVRLTKDETQRALSGKTINYGSKAGNSVRTYFAANGNLTQRVGNADASTGTWSVEDDGRFCIKIIKGRASDVCRSVLRTDAGLALTDSKGTLIPIDGVE